MGEVETKLKLLESRGDSANALGISLRKLDYLIAAKELGVVKIGKRVLIPRRSLEEYCRRKALIASKRTSERTGETHQ